ncbi:MAG: hypothetical protein CVT49_14530 [candidate division Zixibacteria bacterium HGW-Zixibacteria-1]|nr:MAG: hypothetical protein CVT49_14530 [candidate division Zixibacteria bacterium HGW-Zixibacteria-1]
MKRLLLLSIAVLLGLTLIFMSGCGGSDDPVSSTKTTGDPNDPDLAVIETLAGDGNFIIDLQLLDLSFNLYDSIPESAPGKFSTVNSDVSNIIISNYEYSNYWHIFTCSAYVEEAGDYDTTWYAYGGVDSIRASNDDGYMQYPDSTTSGLNIRAHFGVNFEGIPISGELANHASFDIATIDSLSFILDGLSYDSIMFVGFNDSGTCELGIYFYQGIDNLLIDEAVQTDVNACPPQGTIGLNFTVALACQGTSEADSLNVNGSWLANFVFDNGLVHMTYENETTRWTGTEECGGTIAKRGWLSSLK